MMASPNPHDDERDAWLREALRHAPDADVAPPAALSEMILREAQAKARRAAPAPRPPRSLGTRLWIWLAQPVVGAGLASVMIGTVIGVMWWDKPPTAEVSRVAPLPPVAPQPAPMAAPAPLAESRPPPVPPSAEREARSQEEQPAADAARPRQRVAEARREPAPAPPAPLPAVVPPTRNDAVAKAARTADAMAPSAPSAPSVPSAPAEAAAMATPPRADGLVGGQARAPSATTAPASTLTLKSAQQAFPAEARAMQRDLGSLRVAVSTDAEHWSWQRGSAAPRAVDDRVAAWLAQLDTATASRWTLDVSGRSSSGEPSVRLLHDGRVVHVLRLDAGAVHWQRELPEGGGSQAWVAPVDEAPLRSLREALERIAP